MPTINVLKVGYLVLLKLRVTLLCCCICVLWLESSILQMLVTKNIFVLTSETSSYLYKLMLVCHGGNWNGSVIHICNTKHTRIYSPYPSFLRALRAYAPSQSLIRASAPTFLTPLCARALAIKHSTPLSLSCLVLFQL